MKIILVLMCLLFAITSAMATPMKDSHITYDDTVIISDTTEFYDPVSDRYRKCEIIPVDNANVVPEPSTLLMFGLAGLFVMILIVLKRHEIAIPEMMRKILTKHLFSHIKQVCWAWAVVWWLNGETSLAVRSRKCGYCGHCMSLKEQDVLQELYNEQARMRRLLRD